MHVCVGWAGPGYVPECAAQVAATHACCVPLTDAIPPPHHIISLSKLRAPVYPSGLFAAGLREDDTRLERPALSALVLGREVPAHCARRTAHRVAIYSWELAPPRHAMPRQAVTPNLMRQRYAVGAE